MVLLHTALQLGFLYAAVCGNSEQCCPNIAAGAGSSQPTALRRKPEYCPERICIVLFALATRRHIWQLITTTQLEERMIFFTSSTIEECEKISDRYGILHQGRLAAIGPVEAMSMRSSKRIVAECDFKVETAVQSAFPSAVKEATPEGKTEILRWRIPIDGKNRLSAMFERMKNVTSGLPVSNPTLSQCSYEIALTLAATELEAKPKGAPIDALSVMI
ncbi:unnamed protein product [Nippostrongylus brasiliensis]|uniref:ABC transporter ATP-binding protein n=1 Tax=Nippostrongylus brasiliensis TaxID=27835 RepID=A0A0N4Y2M4_NIPBR|nr:unnamed protein product [Nippostrongylus brasiliensis]